MLLLDRAGRKSRWAISKTDHFPRMYEQIMEGFISGTVKVELSGVTLDENEPPTVKPEELRVTVPEGFRADARRDCPARAGGTAGGGQGRGHRYVDEGSGRGADSRRNGRGGGPGAGGACGPCVRLCV